MTILKLLMVLLIVILGAVFASLNSAQVTLNYYFSTLQLPLSVLLVGCLIIGGLLGVLSASMTVIRLKHKLSLSTRRLKTAQNELTDLRKTPLQD
ncbi:MAG: LapA family protein [gamma proteobacterium symbiont of Bathyaustriella thionipta]|nr:LapA family protein [gamma proteobacterium symbiont of Bathyaustriella thionipta]